MVHAERERPRLSWTQVELIKGKKLMAPIIQDALEADQELRDDIVGYMYVVAEEPGRIYEKALLTYMTDPERPIPLTQLIDSPFIRAFEQTKQCTDEEKDFFFRIHVSPDRDTDADLRDQFEDWLMARLPFLAGGLQYAVLASPTLLQLTNELRSSRRRGFHGRDTASEAQLAAFRKGTEASAAQAGPKTYTPEFLAYLQDLYDTGMSDEEVSQELSRLEILEVTPDTLKKVRSRHQLDYPYTRRQEAWVALVERTVSEEQSVAEARKLLREAGYSDRRIKHALHTLTLRQRIDWHRPLMVDEHEVPLAEVMRHFMTQGYGTLKEEHTAFVVYLRANGIDTSVSYKAYCRKRLDLV